MQSHINVRFPLLLPFLAFVSGIILDYTLSPEPSLCHMLTALFLIGLGTSVWHPAFKASYSRRTWFGILIFMFFQQLGMVNHQFFRLAGNTPLDNTKYLLYHIVHPPEKRENSIRLIAKELHLFSGRSIGRVMLYLEKNEEAELLTSGDLILVRAESAYLNPPANPGEFNYQKYLQTKGIDRSEYVSSGRWKLWQHYRLFSLMNLSLQLRDYLLHEIDGWPVDDEAKSLAKALILGERKSVNPGQLEAYAAAGAMHILAVSGLHTGIFYLVLSLLFSPIKKWKYGRTASSLLIVIILWCYAFVTGLSASVVRAVCMFSLLALGNSMRRPVNVYNTILASAFILLLISPGYLFQVGFQLSYAALLGIVSIQPVLSSALKKPHWLTRKIWDLIAVSIAAQITTLPLALFYFHQFPTLFIITNLIVIPLVSIIMYLGLLCLLISTLPLSPALPYQLFNLLVGIMNAGVTGIESLGLHLTNLYISALAGLSIYFLIIFGYRWWISGLYKNLLRTGLLTLVLVILSSYRWIILNHTEFIVYCVPGSAVLGIFRNDEGVIYSDHQLLSDSTKMSFKLSGHWLKRSATNPARLDWERDTSCSYFTKCGPLIQSSDKRLLIYRQHYYRIPVADVWIVAKNLPPPDQWEEVPASLVLTSGISADRCVAWEKWCLENGVESWNVNRRGAWTTNESFF